MSKRVSVMYTTDSGESVSCVRGMKSVILIQDGDDVDLTAVNMEGFDEVCDVLQEALDKARSLKPRTIVEGVAVN